MDPLGSAGTSREDYEVTAVLGKGSYGTCYRVRRRKNTSSDTGSNSSNRDEQLVMKVIPLAGLSETQRNNTLHEATLMARLNHPNLVASVDSWCEQDWLFIVMKYYEGGSLAGALAARKGGGLPEAEIWTYVAHVSRALEYLHGNRVLHRDIKPCNIFLQSGRAVLADLGLSLALGPDPAMLAASLVGTPIYFSPELCLGRSYDSKSDIWALGVTMHELAAGRPPFRAANQILLAQRIIGRPPPLLPAGYSPALQSLVTAMLAKEPADRPSAADMLRRVPIPMCLEAADARERASAAQKEADGAKEEASRLRVKCRELEALLIRERQTAAAALTQLQAIFDEQQPGSSWQPSPPAPPPPPQPPPAPQNAPPAAPPGQAQAQEFPLNPQLGRSGLASLATAQMEEQLRAAGAAVLQCQILNGKCEALAAEAVAHARQISEMRAAHETQAIRSAFYVREIGRLQSAVQDLLAANEQMDERLRRQEVPPRGGSTPPRAASTISALSAGSSRATTPPQLVQSPTLRPQSDPSTAAGSEPAQPPSRQSDAPPPAPVAERDTSQSQVSPFASSLPPQALPPQASMPGPSRIPNEFPSRQEEPKTGLEQASGIARQARPDNPLPAATAAPQDLAATQPDTSTAARAPQQQQDLPESSPERCPRAPQGSPPSQTLQGLQLGPRTNAALHHGDMSESSLSQASPPPLQSQSQYRASTSARPHLVVPPATQPLPAVAPHASYGRQVPPGAVQREEVVSSRDGSLQQQGGPVDSVQRVQQRWQSAVRQGRQQQQQQPRVQNRRRRSSEERGMGRMGSPGGADASSWWRNTRHEQG